MKLVIPEKYCKTREEIRAMLSAKNKIKLTPEILLMIDYAYYHDDPNYEDGLSFLDRLYNKLSKYFNVNWPLDIMKNTIRNAPNPFDAFLNVLGIMLDNQEMMECYGI
jgi:hypothetical protein